jgi:hypothetical protein
MGATYHVAKERDKWAIFVDGMGQIVCEDRDAAISIARRAADLLRAERPGCAASVDVVWTDQ